MLLDILEGLYSRFKNWLQPAPKMRFTNQVWDHNTGRWVSEGYRLTFDKDTPEPEEIEEEPEEKEGVISNPFQKMLDVVPREKKPSNVRFAMKVVPPSDLVSRRRRKVYSGVEEAVSRLTDPIERMQREPLEREEEPATRLVNPKEESVKFAETFVEKGPEGPIKLERIDEAYKAELKEKTLEDYRESEFDNIGTLVIRKRLAEPKPLFSDVRHPRLKVKGKQVDGLKLVEFEAEEPAGKVFDIFEHGTHKSIREFE